MSGHYFLEARVQLDDKLFPDQPQVIFGRLTEEGRRSTQLTKAASRDLMIDIPMRDRAHFPSLATLPPPAPYNEEVIQPYAHRWSPWNTEQIAGYIGSLPPEAMAAAEQLIAEASEAFGVSLS